MELAITVVEACTRHGRLTEYATYSAKLKSMRKGGLLSTAEHAFLDHVLRMLIGAGMMKRHHVGPGVIQYGPTPKWGDRESVLGPLRYERTSRRIWRLKRSDERREARKIQREAARVAANLARRAARNALLEARRQERIAQRGLTPSGNVRRKSRADRMIARGDLVLSYQSTEVTPQ